MFHPQGPTFCELAMQALSSTERGYDLLAPKFDYTPFLTPQPVIEAAAHALAPLGPFASGLDLCCGTGAGMMMLRPLCTERVVGIDFSQGMLAIAKQKAPAAPGDARLEFVHGNALEMPFENEFDLIVCFGALGHILPRDEERFLAQVVKALRPGGRFAIVTGERPPWWSWRLWAAHGFNAAMWIRNLLIRPPFVMYYLNFLLPQVADEFAAAGLVPEVHPLPGFRHARLLLGARARCPRSI
jgi:SAM-dependent methyltransferase